MNRGKGRVSEETDLAPFLPSVDGVTFKFLVRADSAISWKSDKRASKELLTFKILPGFRNDLVVLCAMTAESVGGEVMGLFIRGADKSWIFCAMDLGQLRREMLLTAACDKYTINTVLYQFAYTNCVVRSHVATALTSVVNERIKCNPNSLTFFHV